MGLAAMPEHTLDRILVADDEPGVLDLFRDILAPELADARLDVLERRLFGPGREAADPDYEVTLCPQGDLAVTAVEQALKEGRPYGLAFLDVRMPPGPDGVWTAQAIRRLDPDIQIVLVTAFSDVDTADIAQLVPPADKLLYQRKPFHPQEILQFARSLCAKWRSEREHRALSEDLRAQVLERTRELEEANARLLREIREGERVGELILAAKREWEQTFDSVGEPILLLDADNRIRRINMAGAARVGKHPRDLAGRGLEELAGADAAAELAELVRTALRTGQGAELTVPALGSSFLVTASSLPDTGGGSPLTVAVAHDITEHKALEAKLRQAQKMEALGTLAGGIAHDFNNILGIIMGFSELMAAEATPDTPQARRLEQILEASRRARDLVAQILAFSRQQGAQVRSLGLRELVSRLMPLLRASLPKSITIDLDLRAKRDVIQADPSQIEQILMNLCSNAVHAMRHQSGRLSVTLTEVVLDEKAARSLDCPEPGAYARLRVKDTGHGIPARDLDRIFDPFFTTKKPGEGTGMGLSVVHGIVRAHGGSISVKSEVGEGTVFDVYLPLAEAAPVRAEEAAEAPSGGGRILWVDDEEALVEIAQATLTALGYQATCHRSPVSALAELAAAPRAFDILVTDLAMPDMTGLELARQVQVLCPGLPILLLTGFSESLSPEELRQAGVREVLAKPVSRDRLAQALGAIAAA